MKRTRTYYTLTPLLIACALAALFGILSWFRRSMNRELSETTERYLTENVNAMAAVFFTKLDDQMVMLESQTRYFQDVDLTDYNQMKHTILSTRGFGSFKSIGVASPAGSTMNYNGMSSGNILLSDYFQEAIAGNGATSSDTFLDEEGESVLAMAVPIWQSEETVGVIYGTFSQATLGELVDTVRFAQIGANCLITEEGTILARTLDTPYLREDAQNLFREIPQARLPDDQESAVYEYRQGEERMLVVLTSVGAHNWYFATILPQSVVSSQSRLITQDVGIVILLVSLVFILLLLYLVLMMRRSNRIETTLTRKASTDSLTGTLNKTAFEDSVRARIREGAQPLALYIIDLDNFKHVNDTLGHALGDTVLSELCDKLRTIFPEENSLGRIGGDEFAACMTLPFREDEANYHEIRRRAKAACRLLQSVYRSGEISANVSVSVGIACFPSDAPDYLTLYQNADRALYLAKENGKSRFVIYADAMHGQEVS